MRFFLLSLTFLLSGWVLFSACNSSGNGREDTDRKTISSNQSETTRKSRHIVFKSPEDVTEFLKFKRFSTRGSNIAFNGEGGTVDGEFFKLSSIKIINPEEARISIYVPSVKLTGEYTLMISNDSVFIIDPETKAKYMPAEK